MCPSTWQYNSVYGRRGLIMKIAIILYTNDSETVWNAFRFANTSLVRENEVTVFLLGKGIEAPTVGTFQFDINEQWEKYIQGGGKIIGCGVCCEMRLDIMPNLKDQLRCEIGSMQQMYDVVASSDRVLTF